MLNTSHNPLKPVAILDGRGVSDKNIAGVPVLGKLNKLEEILVQKRISHLIQCSDMEQSLNLLSACRNHSITYIVLPSVFGIVERDETVESLEGIPVTVVRPRGGWMGWFTR
jgi:cobyrinic acid a,c-diamide synthase